MYSLTKEGVKYIEQKLSPKDVLSFWLLFELDCIDSNETTFNSLSFDVEILDTPKKWGVKSNDAQSSLKNVFILSLSFEEYRSTFEDWVKVIKELEVLYSALTCYL